MLMVANNPGPSVTRLVKEASEAQEQGDMPRAESLYRQLLVLEPKDSWALHNLTTCLMHQERNSEALALARGLLRIPPVSAESLRNIGWLLARVEDTSAYENDIGEVLDGFESYLRQDGSDEAVQLALNNLIADFQDRLRGRYRPVLVSSVGGSGTYFTIHFFNYLDRRLGSYKKDYDPLQGGVFQTVLALSRLQLLKVTTHALCPGFEENYHGAYRATWDRFVEESKAERIWEEVRHHFDPSVTPETRIVHIHRDPREWVKTVYRAKIRTGGFEGPPERLLDEIIGTQLKRFVAQYFSYRAMAERHPNQIMLLPFETLTADPFRTFQRILSFFEVPEVSPDLIRSSIKSSSPEALMRLEDRTGKATGPTGPSTHFDRNRAERERTVLSEQDLSRIAGSFEELGIPLTEFGG